LRLTSVVGDEEADIGVVQDGGDTDQTRTASGNDSHVLPRILAILALSMVLVIEVGDGLSKRFDTGYRAIFSAGNTDIDGLRALEAPLDVILYLVF
jgi:hypothetical protein